MKKGTSMLTAMAVALTMSTPVLAAPDAAQINFNSASTNGAGNAWLLNCTEAGAASWNTQSGWGDAFNTAKEYKYNFSIADGVLGKKQGDKSWKLSLNKSLLRLWRTNSTANTTDGDNFYIQESVYVNDVTYPNLFQAGGAHTLTGSKDIVQYRYVMFGSDGKIYKDKYKNNLADAYEKNNWYTITTVFEAKNGVTNASKTYIDGKELSAYSYDFSSGNAWAVKNAYGEIGWTLENGTSANEESDPFWNMTDDVKVVQGTFDPADTNTDISSSVYTVQNPTFLASGSQSEAKVSGIEYGTTAQELISALNAPAGGNVEVVRINPQTDTSAAVLDSDDLRTVTVADSETVDDTMTLVSTAKDGNIKLYKLDVSTPASYEANAVSSVYTVDNDAKTIGIVPRGTSVERFLAEMNVSYGAAAKLVNPLGAEVNTGIVNPNLTYKVTSADESVTNEYSIITDSGNITDYRGSTSYLNDHPEGLLQKLVGYSGGTVDGVAYPGNATNTRTSMPGFYGGLRSWNFPTTDTTSEVNFSKVKADGGEWAYEFENPTKYDVVRNLSGKTLTPYNTNVGDDIIVKYTIYPKTRGRYATSFDILCYRTDRNQDNQVIYPEWATGRATPNLVFESDSTGNKIYFGAKEYQWGAGRGAQIGTWTPGERYDIVIALKDINKDSDAFYVKGLWINDEKITLTNLGFATAAGDYARLNNADNNQSIYAPVTPSSISGDSRRNGHEGWGWNSVGFSAASFDGTQPGIVDYSNIFIYTANGYSPDAQLWATSGSMSVDEENSVIRGYSGTANDVISAVQVPEGAFACVVSGDQIADGSAAAENGMKLRVYTNDCSQYRDYTLNNSMDKGEFEFYDETGFVPAQSVSEAGSELNIVRTVRKYTDSDEEKFVLAAAVFDAQTDKFLGVQLADESEYSDVDGLTLTVDLTSYDADSIYVKAMFLESMQTLKPYDDAAVLPYE